MALEDVLEHVKAAGADLAAVAASRGGGEGVAGAGLGEAREAAAEVNELALALQGFVGPGL